MAWYESWFESDLYDLMYKHRDDQEAEAFLSRLLDHLAPGKEEKILDLACGTGRHSRYVRSRGFRTTGIDLSKRNISIASQYADDLLEFFIQDMRKPFRINYYNIVMNLFTSFGYFDDIKDNEKVLKSVKSALKPGGVFILDFMNGSFIKKTLIANETKHYGDWEVFITRAVIENRLIKNMQWKNGTLKREYSEKVTLFSHDELLDMLVKWGFEVESKFGDYDLRNYDEDSSPRLILISKC